MMPQFIIFFIFSTFVTWILAGNKLGINLIDHPNERSLHTRPTPRTGGLAIALTMILAYLFNISVLPTVIDKIAIGAVLVLVISVADDIKHVPSLVRLLVHLIAATWLVYSGLEINSIILPGGNRINLANEFSWIITILFITWMTNLYNFMDGMDGFAGGMTVSGFIFLAIFLFPNSATISYVCFLIVAATSGFLVFNFPPAKIFMGDSGSSVLGYLSASFMLFADKSEAAPLWITIIVFSPFIIDATVTLLIRAANKQRIWLAHKQHFYQKLVESGWSHRKTVLAEYCLMFFCGLISVAGKVASKETQILIVGLIAILYITIILIIQSLQNKINNQSE